MANVFQVWTRGEARFCVAIVDDPAMADLWVYRVHSVGMARRECDWFINPERENSQCWLYFGSQGEAQLKVHFVSSRGLAGWQKKHPLQGQLR